MFIVEILYNLMFIFTYNSFLIILFFKNYNIITENIGHIVMYPLTIFVFFTTLLFLIIQLLLLCNNIKTIAQGLYEKFYGLKYYIVTLIITAFTILMGGIQPIIDRFVFYFLTLIGHGNATDEELRNMTEEEYFADTDDEEEFEMEFDEEFGDEHLEDTDYDYEDFEDYFTTLIVYTAPMYIYGIVGMVESFLDIIAGGICSGSEIATLYFLRLELLRIYSSATTKMSNFGNIKYNSIINKTINLGTKYYKYINGIYKFFATTIISILITSIIVFYAFFYLQINALKQYAVWFVIGVIFLGLMSGFNFFIKRYKFGKFTSAIQRFGKRTNSVFGLIEGFLFTLFFYYYLNSSQEPIYFFDYASLNKEFLPQLSVGMVNLIILGIIIYLAYNLLIKLSHSSFFTISVYMFIISILIFSMFFIETYQFYYVLTSFYEQVGKFDDELEFGVLEDADSVLRTKTQYFLLCLLAKYGHFLFIFITGIFFLVKFFELKHISYSALSINVQNLVILYCLNILCLIQGVKGLFRRFLEIPYTGFFTTLDNKPIIIFLQECGLIICSVING